MRQSNVKMPFEPQYDELVKFRQEHTVKKLSYLDKEWSYYSCGQGKDVIIILPGGLGTGEAAFCYIQSFEKHHKVISPTYPDAYTMDELVEGLNKIIETESAEHITLFGVSFGGLLEQCYIKKYPQKVENLILAHTTTITPDCPEEETTSMIKLLGKTCKIIEISPAFIMKIMLYKKFRRLSKRMGSEEEFWWKYFKEIIKTFDKNGIISEMHCMIDFACNYKFEYGYLDNWKGKILILEADDDTSFSGRQKELFKSLYKDAKVHTDHGFGHLTSFVKRDLYIKLIEEFVTIS